MEGDGHCAARRACSSNLCAVHIRIKSLGLASSLRFEVMVNLSNYSGCVSDKNRLVNISHKFGEASGVYLKSVGKIRNDLLQPSASKSLHKPVRPTSSAPQHPDSEERCH